MKARIDDAALDTLFREARTPTRLDPLPTAPETEPGLSEDSTFFQMLQCCRCDLFVHRPEARRLWRRHGEIGHLLKISSDSPTSIVHDAAAHSSTEACRHRFKGLGIAELYVLERHGRVCR